MIQALAKIHYANAEPVTLQRMVKRAPRLVDRDRGPRRAVYVPLEAVLDTGSGPSTGGNRARHSSQTRGH
jgi:hypothetical protein